MPIELLKKAQVQKARVILVGDIRQLSAVEAGNPFKSLQMCRYPDRLSGRVAQAKKQKPSVLPSCVCPQESSVRD